MSHLFALSFLQSMIRQAKLAPNSVECAAIYNNLGKAYGKLHEFNQAIESLVQALWIRNIELGNHLLVDYGHSVFILAKIYLSMKKYYQAECIRCFLELGAAELWKQWK